MTESEDNSRKLTWVLALATAALSAAVFIPAIPGSWIYDDHTLIAQNPFVHSMHWWPRWFTTDFWQVNEEIVRFGNRMVYWRPLVTGTYAVDWQVGGGSPVWFHVMNLLWQAVVGVLAFFTLRRWVGAALPAFAAAVLFAVHPTKAESVAWIAGRTDVLCMIGVFLASAGIARRLRKQKGGIALEIAGTLIAYGCKEQAIVLPAFAAVELWVFAQRPPIDLALVRRITIVALPQIAVAIGYFALRALFMPVRAAEATGALDFSDHVQSILDTIGRFFSLTVAPYELSIQQGLVEFDKAGLLHSTPHMVLGLIGTAALAALAIVARRRWPAVTLGIGFYLFTLAPTANIIYTRMQTLVSERFLYLPLFGLALIIGVALGAAKGKARRIGFGLVAALTLWMGVMSLRRAADYSSERAFWLRELKLNPRSREARHYTLASALREKRFVAALFALRELLEVQQDRMRDRFGIALQLADTLAALVPDRDVAGLLAIDEFCVAILERKPTAVLAMRGVSFTFPTSSKAYLRWLVEFKGRLLALRAKLRSRLGEDTLAVQLATEAAENCHPCASIAPVQATIFARAGRYIEALEVLDRVEGLIHETPVELTREHIEKAFRLGQAAMSAQGPQALQLRASELSALELWGRAYDVLAPHKDAIKRAPNFALGFAELAFRAGDTPVARDVLAANVPATEIDVYLEKWAITMGWKEPTP